MEKYLKRLCKEIENQRFNYQRYRDRKGYRGIEIQTGPLHCSYGTIGFTVDVYGNKQFHLGWDWEMKELTINDKPYQEVINELYLEDTDMRVYQCSGGDYELELYTDAGGDMIISLDHLMKDELEEYIEKFDINHEVAIWWPNGEPGNGVPFDNIKEHYEDLEDWVAKVKKIAKRMPF